MMRFIAAVDRKRGLAKHGFMPWYIPEDEQYFTHQTKTFGGNVLTGGVTFRNTYHARPLVGRQNFILSRDPTPIPGTTVINSLSKFLEEFKDQELWVAGGAAVFEQIISTDYDIELCLTLVDADFGCDQFFPEYEHTFELTEQSEPHEQNGFHFTYIRYIKKT